MEGEEDGEEGGAATGFGARRLGLETAFFSPAAPFLAPDVPGIKKRGNYDDVC